MNRAGVRGPGRNVGDSWGLNLWLEEIMSVRDMTERENEPGAKADMTVGILAWLWWQGVWMGCPGCSRGAVGCSV